MKCILKNNYHIILSLQIWSENLELSPPNLSNTEDVLRMFPGRGREAPEKSWAVFPYRHQKIDIRISSTAQQFARCVAVFPTPLGFETRFWKAQKTTKQKTGNLREV